MSRQSIINYHTRNDILMLSGLGELDQYIQFKKEETGSDM